MLQDARHLPRGRRYTGDGHYGLLIDFQNLVRAIVDNGVTSSGTAISRNQNAAGKFERKDRCPLGRLPCRLLRRVLRHRTDGNRTEQTSAPQQRRKVIRCTRKVLVKSQL